MKEWMKNNWDKVLFPVQGIVISGVVGFYTAISAVDAKLSTLGERVTRNETEIQSTIKPQLSTLDNLKAQTRKLTQDTEFLKTKIVCLSNQISCWI
ncbi:MAG: hypothetical protein GKR94_27985 [Gammaproteobacteria bacterium]|nr:hypothetical protein [Gammaproteobacteria bacterium]